MKVEEQLCVPDKYAPETSFKVKPGDRVELHPALDLWMMGDRCGEVVSLGALIRVRLDASKRVVRLDPNNIGRKL